jgi:hypothetical protein
VVFEAPLWEKNPAWRICRIDEYPRDAITLVEQDT